VTATPAAPSSVALIPPATAEPEEGALEVSRPPVLDAPPFDPRQSSPTLRASGTPPPPGRTAVWWRRPVATIAATGVALLAAMLVLSRLIETAPATKPGDQGQAAPAQPEIARVPCGQAEVMGSLAVPSAPRVLGAAACARLAVEMGVEWSMQPAEPALRVVVDVTSSPVRATLSLAGAEARGEGDRPIAAIQAAIAPLAAALRAPAPAPAVRASFGAASPEDAARAVRELRRAGLLLSPSPRLDLTRWSESDARSPWPWLLLAATSAAGDPIAAAGRDRALPLLDALPPARAAVARGIFLSRVPARPGDAVDGLGQLRRAYVLAPDDAEVSALLAAELFRAGRTDEAMPVAKRVLAQGPQAKLAALVLAADTDADPQWLDERGRVLDALEAWLPEARAWPSRTRHELRAGRTDAAKQGVELAAALGLPTAARADLDRAWIALELLDAKRARELSRPMVVSPDPAVAEEAVRVLVQSFLLEGRASDAQTELARDIERQRALGNERLLAARFAWLLSILRRTGQPVPAFIDQPNLHEIADRLAAVDDPLSMRLEAELLAALVTAGQEKPPAAEALMKRAEEFAARVAQGDRTARDAALSAVAPLARLSLRPPEALKWHRSLSAAPYAARLPNIVALGAACEEGGDAACAEASYREAARSPAVIDGLEHVLARLRLARLLDKRGDKDAAARMREPVTRLLASADEPVAKLAQQLGK
jgi:hypothetical protein